MEGLELVTSDQKDKYEMLCGPFRDQV
jgi:hypothetical protein